MKKFLHFTIIAFLLSQNAFSEQSISKEEEFLKRRNDIHKYPDMFDYLAFRKLYTETRYYKPYTGGETLVKQKTNESVTSKEFNQCVAFADEWLDINYTSVEAHFNKYICCKSLGDRNCASTHYTIVNGLLDSIYKSGDGKTPESAYETFNTDEIYFFLNANGLRLTEQRLLNKNGRVYDVMDTKHAESGNTYTIYFDITVQMTNENDNI